MTDARRIMLVALCIAGNRIAAIGDWIAAGAARRLGKLSGKSPEGVRR